MRIIHVLRKPLSEGTVASNVLKYGVGGLNIDASRIGTTDSLGGGRLAGPTRMDQTCGGNEWDRPWMTDPSLREGYAKATAEKVAKAENLGRWPANVILQHLDGCRCDGVKRVKGQRGSGLTPTPARSWKNTSVAGINRVGHADEDGKETVANWICEPGCPVARLDEQSGVLAPQGGQKHKDTKEGSFLNTGFGGSPTSAFYGDTGGASRFYKQVGGKTDG